MLEKLTLVVLLDLLSPLGLVQPSKGIQSLKLVPTAKCILTLNDSHFHTGSVY